MIFLNKNQKKLIRLCLVFLFLPLFIWPTSAAWAAGSLFSYKDTLSTSRPSVLTPITGSLSSGTTTINVASTNGLYEGDAVTLCNNAACGTQESKIIANISSPTQFTLTAVTANPYTSASYVWYKSMSTQTVSFTPSANVSNGKFNIYIPGDSNPNDGLSTTTPTVGFDFNGMTLSTTTDVTMSVAGATATTTTVSTSTSGSNMVFTINFTGTIASSTAVTITIGAGATKLINPVKSAVGGVADTYTIETDELDISSALINTSSVAVATIENVAVSLTVPSAMAFTINPVATSTIVAGHPTDGASTATSVPFGALAISATTTIAQYLHVETDSTSGYTVTVQQDGSLRKTNGTTIVDFNSSSFADNDGVVGFGFALQNKVNTPVAAANTYNNGGAKFNSIGFSSTTPFTIMSATGPANNDEAYVAYRLKVNVQQPLGDYTNLITYIVSPVY